jgi:hypothetical protein
MHTLLLALDVFMGLYFIFAAAVNHNDPDPIRWMSIYLAAAVCCGFSFAGRLPWAASAALGAIALVWAATIAPQVVGKVSFRSMFATWKMTTPGIEDAREMYGLLIVVVWMAVISVAAYR